MAIDDVEDADLEHLPLPEALDGHSWEVTKAPRGGGAFGPATNITAHKMRVYCEGDDLATLSRLHEMMHVAYSPADPEIPEGCPEILYQAVEDMRLMTIAQRQAAAGSTTGKMLTNLARKVDLTDEVTLKKIVKKLDADGDLRSLVAMLVSADGTHTAHVMDHIPGKTLAKAKVLVRRCKAYMNERMPDALQIPGHYRTQKVTKFIQQQINAYEEVQKEEQEEAARAKGLKRKSEDGWQPPTEEEIAGKGDELQEASKEILRIIEKLKEQEIPLSMHDGSAPWGELVLETPALSLYQQDKVDAGPTYKPAEEGTLLRNPHRWIVDRRIFTYRRKKPGGTILIDASGSMRWNLQTLVELMERCPAGTIAIYWGEGATGGLRIVAKQGRRVRPEDLVPRGCANVIDGPALEWLAKQEHPRIWVSDGGITGIGDQAVSERTRIAVDLFNARHRIRMVGNTAQALLALKGKYVAKQFCSSRARGATMALL